MGRLGAGSADLRPAAGRLWDAGDFVVRGSEAIGVLPVTAEWHEWVGEWDMEVEAPGCEVLAFRMKR